MDSWDTQLNLGINHSNLSTYFEMAKGFIGVNKIPTTTAMVLSNFQKQRLFRMRLKK